MAANSVWTFEEYGEESADILLLFSPFLPYQNVCLNDFFYHSTIKYKKVYANLAGKNKFPDEAYSYDNLINGFKDYITAQKQQHIILVGYGIFCNLFVRLTKMLDDKIASLIIIEPDFGNSVLTKLFDSDKKPVHKKNYFEETFTKDLNMAKIKKVLSAHYFKHIKALSPTLLEKLPQTTALKEILDIRQKCLIMWHLMEKDLWPLPQILQEDYSIKTISVNNNIIGEMLLADKDLMAQLNFYITEKINK